MKRWLAAAAALICPVLVADCSERGQPVTFRSTFGDRKPTAVPAPANGVSLMRMPTGPEAPFTVERTVDEADSTKIGVTAYHGRKSGFTGKIWVWAPPQYFQPEYATKGFPVLIALPGGPGYPSNYWFGADLHLQEDVYAWSQEGKSLPFILVMPVLNPDRRYHDCRDIPGLQR